MHEIIVIFIIKSIWFSQRPCQDPSRIRKAGFLSHFLKPDGLNTSILMNTFDKKYLLNISL